MKQGSHIMLQRFVRSMVSTDPRPCSTVLLPWLCSFSSLCARMSRPGKTSSRCLKNAGSVDMTSSNFPWIAHSFTMTIFPSFSMILALISPAFSFLRISTGSSPLMILLRMSGTHLGQSESVSRGQPSFGFCFSQLLSRGLSDHFGVKDALRLMELNLLKKNHAALAPTAMAFSTCLIGLVKV